MNMQAMPSARYVILTSKPGQYHTEAVAGIVPLDTYDYVDSGRCVATFVVALLSADTKVRIVDDTDPSVVNLVPTRFLENFATLDAAREALHQLAGHGGTHARLNRR